MRLRVWFCGLVATTLLAGCKATTVNLYPVRGPWALDAPTPIITASVEGIGGPSGRITMTMPDRETCTGQWSAVSSQGATPLWDQFGTVAGFTHVPGRPPGTRNDATLTCARGTTVQAEYYTGTVEQFGVATDSRGNVYRILF